MQSITSVQKRLENYLSRHTPNMIKRDHFAEKVVNTALNALSNLIALGLSFIIFAFKLKKKTKKISHDHPQQPLKKVTRIAEISLPHPNSPQVKTDPPKEINMNGLILTLLIAQQTRTQTKDLHLIAALGMVEQVKEVLNKNPSLIHVSNEKGTQPIHLACRNSIPSMESHLEVVKLFHQHGADLSAKDAAGNSPLHFTQDPKMIRYLCDNGVIVNITNHNNETPLDLLYRLQSEGRSIYQEAIQELLQQKQRQ